MFRRTQNIRARRSFMRTRYQSRRNAKTSCLIGGFVIYIRRPPSTMTRSFVATASIPSHLRCFVSIVAQVCSSSKLVSSSPRESLNCFLQDCRTAAARQKRYCFVMSWASSIFYDEYLLHKGRHRMLPYKVKPLKEHSLRR